MGLMSVLARCIMVTFAATSGGVVSALQLQVFVHYPEQNSVVDRCGFRFKIATSPGDATQSTPAEHVGRDSFKAVVQLPDSQLFTQVLVGVLADFGDIRDPKCEAVCPKMGPQGAAVQSGPYLRTEPLGLDTRVDIWPAFCRLNPGVSESSFYSKAIGRKVIVKSRVPAAYLENALPRPTELLPPVLFRLNSEWYWPQNEKNYDTWHELMVAGTLQPFVVGEVHIEGVVETSWETQPIYTTEPLRHSCGICDPEISFICESWQSSGYYLYQGGNHSFGRGAAFFDNLYDNGLPQVLKHLPARLDKAAVQVGVWGYCIGGLGAWSAILTRPDRFNIAYLGSPAVDFNCGASLLAAESFSWGARRPKIYIDSGDAEGDVMNRQALLLFRKLEARGLVEGQDLFYSRSEFGTHQQTSLLRRAHRGLLVLFGAGEAGRDVYVPTAKAMLSDQMSVGVTKSAFHEGLHFHLLAALLAVAIFWAGHRSATMHLPKFRSTQQPLLSSVA